MLYGHYFVCNLITYLCIFQSTFHDKSSIDFVRKISVISTRSVHGDQLGRPKSVDEPHPSTDSPPGSDDVTTTDFTGLDSNLETHNIFYRTDSRFKSLAAIFKSRHFSDDAIERLYQRYFYKLHLRNLRRFLVLMVTLSAILIAFHYVRRAAESLTTAIFLSCVICACVALILVVSRDIRSPEVMPANRRVVFNHVHMRVTSLALLLTCASVIIIVVLQTEPTSAAEAVWCVIFFTFVVYTSLPLRMRVAILSGCFLIIVHIIVTSVVNGEDEFFPRQVSKN